MAVGGRHTDTGQKKDHRGLRAPKRLPETGPPGGRRSPGGGGWDETWNVEVRSVDVKAGGHRRVLLVLHLPVLWGEWGEQAGPGAGCLCASPLSGPIYLACPSVSFTPAHHVPWGASAHLV